MSQRNLPLDYLKTTVIVLVVAFHSVIAYCVFSPVGVLPFDTEHFLGNPGPVLDSVRWSGFDYFFRIIDTCMMPLMFFVSGLFVWPSLKRKGSQAFVRDRVVRLGVPYAVAVVLLMPLAFFPSFLMTGSDLGAASFIAHYYSIAEWPASPAWFIWVLLVFNCVLVGLIALVPGTRVFNLSGISQFPLMQFLCLALNRSGHADAGPASTYRCAFPPTARHQWCVLTPSPPESMAWSGQR